MNQALDLGPVEYMVIAKSRKTLRWKHRSRPGGSPSIGPPAPPPPPAATARLTDEMINEMKKLAELRDAGILTEDEFAGRKSLLLG